MSGLVGQPGPKTLPPSEPFPPSGLSDSRAHDPEGSDRAIHVSLKRIWLQSQNLAAKQTPVDKESGYAQFVHKFSTGPILGTAASAIWEFEQLNRLCRAGIKSCGELKSTHVPLQHIDSKLGQLLSDQLNV